MSESVSSVVHPAAEGARGPLGWYHRTPLFARILASLVLGIIVGKLWGHGAAVLKPFSDIVLQFLKLLATPLIFIAVIHALVRAKVSGRTAGRLAFLLLTNTVAAICIGLLVVNIVRPGRMVHLTPATAITTQPFNAGKDLRDKIPENLIDPFQKNEIVSIIILAVAFGLALRIARAQQEREGKSGFQIVEDLLDTGFRVVMAILHWIFDLVPLAVFAVVARTVGTQGIGPLVAMGGFVVSVLIALALQSAFYLTRLRLGSWVRPRRFLAGASDGLLTAFSTSSSAATLPITYACAKDKIGVREESAGIGIMVGGTFNHDGTALYEAMAALFVAQGLGLSMSLGHQITIVFLAIVASVGAAGIPEAGLVTMLAVFSAVHLPTEFIPLLLPLDWFLDRCRTAINVMGDMTVTCLLDGKQPQAALQESPALAPPVENTVPASEPVH